MTKYIFLHRRCGQFGGQGRDGRGARPAAQGARLQRLDPEARSRTSTSIPGTMSPYQHGEVFVLDDGAETDLDLGHYERFIDISLSRVCNVTTGQIYAEVIAQGTARRLPGRHDPGHPAHHERDQAAHRPGGQDDRTPRSCWWKSAARWATSKSLPFLEALRQMRNDVGRENTVFIHVTWLPHIGATGRTEDQADAALGARTALDRHLARHDRRPLRLIRSATTCASKIALFCDVEPRAVIPLVDDRRAVRGAAAAGARGPGRLHDRAAGADSRSGARSGRRGRTWSTRWRQPTAARCRSPWWASTWSCRTPT